MSKNELLRETWRVGSRVGRTIYNGPGPDDLIGTMDTREAAKLAAAAPEMARVLEGVLVHAKAGIRLPYELYVEAKNVLEKAGLDPELFG